MGKQKKTAQKNKKSAHNIKTGIRERENNEYRHLFRLVAMATKRPCKYEDVQADFAPLQIIPKIYEYILPIFNRDGRYWTDSFILAHKKDYYLTNPRKQREKFNKKLQQKLQYHFPTPQNRPIPIISSLHPYCQICKVEFQQYYLHIQTDDHLLSSKKSPANAYISELIKTYPKQLVVACPDRISLQQNETVYQNKQKKIKKAGKSGRRK